MGTTTEAEQDRSISEPAPSAGPSKGRKRAITGFGLAMLIVLGFAVFLALNFKTVQVSGRSMFPTFKDGERVLVSKAYWLVGPLKDSDVVVLKDDGPTGFIIKRVFKMGGEKVDYSYLPDNYPITNGPYVVPTGMIYVLGDNLPESQDSRVFGPRRIEDVLGKVIKRP